MLFPIRTDSPLRSTPYMNWAIVAANVVMFVVQAAVPGFDDRFALYSHDPWWPAFVTYSFLHGGVAHLLGNMLFLYIFGNNVNDKMGHLAYLAFYLAGAVFGGVGYVTLSGGQNAVVGASGAVAAVTGAYLVLFPRATITLVYFFFLIGTFEASSFWLIGLFFVKDLVGLGPGLSGVAYSAHVAGTVYGLAICAALLGAQLLPRDQFDVLAMVRQWNRRRQYRDLVNKGFDPFGSGSPRTPARGGPGAAAGPADAAAARVSDLRSAISEAVARHDMDTAVQRFTELRAIDPRQVVSRQAQLDIANHLAALQRYNEAAGAYEAFLQTYPKYDQIEQVQLMLGIVYSRYLGRYAEAKQHLEAALPRLFGEREQALARAELAKAEAAAVK
jgi:membrane associated rhomboid family serine protease